LGFYGAGGQEEPTFKMPIIYVNQLQVLADGVIVSF
jgi:hypothetical protein